MTLSQSEQKHMTPDYDQIETPAIQRRQWVKWAPEFNSGSVGIIITIATCIFYFGGKIESQRVEMDNIKIHAAEEGARVKESINALTGDVRQVQTSMNQAIVTLAIIKSQQEQRVGK